ncbi:hypothetical protein HWQ46_13080 [Shewanella sp. D64]|uniref:hypothetical protein n=1 Tax=unclassified Shewanella TaxID=196818 RepID=UPI0022BA3853|nr:MULTISPECIES: hypothetical protein [unclassified Shewanella]MEC4726483.1 hypothetical protein [Shewanella sp. D64]MEC4737476.1 hypothetical protein [Shewanella sp. E94]WBJ97288.1 hypothetical protein HWQ47_09415 [Shewanella sp. MTB7]
MNNQGKPISNNKPATSNVNNQSNMVKSSISSNQTLVTHLPDGATNRLSSNELNPVQTHLIKPGAINTTSGLTQVSINGNDYNITFISNKNRSDIPLATEYIIKAALDSLTTNTLNSANQQISSASKLISLAKTITFELPQAVKQLVIENNININQLKQLSSRSEGYLLPYAQLIDKKLMLSNDLMVHIPSAVTLPSKKSDGTNQATVLPSIHFNNKWFLSLKPIISEIDIKLSLIDPNKKSEIPTQVDKSLSIAKPDIARLYSHLIKPLESISIKQLISSDNALSPQSFDESKRTLTDKRVLTNLASPPTFQNKKITAVELPPHKNTAENMTTNQVNSKEQLNPAKEIHLNTMTQSSTKIQDSLGGYRSNEYTPAIQATKQALMLTALNKAFGKAGSLPPIVENKHEVKDNLASRLNKLMPQMPPSQLFSLADPNKIRDELIGQLSLNAPFDVKMLVKPLLSHMNSISILFHLLLGVKSSQFDSDPLNNKVKPSQTTLNYFQKLQQKMGASNMLLAMLEKSGTTETAGKLISNLNLYSQASNDINGQSNWYFTLPYSLDQHQDNLEGHFTQETDDDSNNSTRWKLQLKFNLLQGPILIQAKVIETRLNMTISVENSELQTRIDKLLPSLVKKLSAIGLTPDKISTQQSKLPASLLPGDHYLVKIKA